MGRRSSSDSEESGRKDRSSSGRTSRRRRSRSSTRSSSSSSSHSRKRPSVKTSKRRSKSPSRSSRNRRSRSDSSERYQHRSRSKRSTRSRRSRSRSGGRQSKGGGQSRSRQSRSPSVQEIFPKIEKPEVTKTTVIKNEPFKSQKTPEEQLKIKMQMALKAAADADAMLREKGVLSAVKQERGIIELEKPVKSENPISVSEQINRATTIDEINSDGFRQQEFKSGRSITTTNVVQNSQIDDHDIVIFGSTAETNELTTMQTAAVNPNRLGENFGQIAHENLYTDVAAKQERWIRRLYNMRQKKLNGEAMA